MSFDFSVPAAYDEEQKRRFHAEVRRRLQLLAQELGLKPGSYDLRSNPGGIAVSGEITLHHEEIYISRSANIRLAATAASSSGSAPAGRTSPAATTSSPRSRA